MSSGFTDKLYWRFTPHGVAHCMKKCLGGGYQSLCDRVDSARVGGQRCARPPAVLRCARCDVLEMDRRGWDESGPSSKHDVRIELAEGSQCH